jgi:hypothetical protein
MYIIIKCATQKKDFGMVTIVKRITTGLLGLAIAGIVTINCEKSNGPAPSLCEYKYKNLQLFSKADKGSVPVGPAIPIESLKNLIITDAGINDIPMDSIGKIIFTP